MKIEVGEVDTLLQSNENKKSNSDEKKVDENIQLKVDNENNKIDIVALENENIESKMNNTVKKCPFSKCFTTNYLIDNTSYTDTLHQKAIEVIKTCVTMVLKDFKFYYFFIEHAMHTQKMYWCVA